MKKQKSTEETRKESLDNYNSLNPDERLFMQILCVPCKFVREDVLTSAIKILKWKSTKGTLLSSMQTSLLASLMKKDLVRSRDGGLVCNPDVHEIAAREMAINGKYSDVEEALQKAYHKSSNHFFSHQYTNYCNIRRALYTKNHSELFVILDIPKKSWQLSYYSYIKDFVHLCLDEHTPEWLEWLPDQVLYHALGVLVDQYAMTLQDASSILALAENHFLPMSKYSLAPLQTLAQMYILQGNFALAEEMLKNDNTGQGLALKASLNFIYGNHDQAVEDFTIALNVLKKQTKKRIIHFTGIAGIFYTMAAMTRDHGEMHDLLQPQLNFLNKKKNYSLFADSQSLLLEIAQTIMGKIPLKDSSLTGNMLTYRKESLFELVRALGTHWTGQDVSSNTLSQLNMHFNTANENGFVWFAREAALILHKFGKKKPLQTLKDSKKLDKYPPLTELIKPVREWEVSLAALKNLVQDSPSTNGQKKNQRMIWRIMPSGDTYALEPREQVVTKSGKWSKGRPVALKRLLENRNDFDYLTDHDKLICNAIEMESYSVYFSRYHKTDYSLRGDSALVAAAGHPLIFREDDLNQPVELLLEKPTLRVLTEKKSIRICLHPKVPVQNSILPIEESRHRIRLIQFNREHRQIYDITGPDGLKVPASAKKQVMDSIAAIAPLLAVHSDMDGKVQTKAQKVSADKRPLLRLYPINQGIGIDLFVKPIADGNITVRPGEGGKTIFADIDGQQVFTERDLDAEKQSALAIIEECPQLGHDANWSWRVSDLETSLETLLRLQDLGDKATIEWPEGKPLHVSKEMAPSNLKASIKSQQDWFSLEGEMRLDDGRVLEMTKLLSLMENTPGRFVRLEEGDFLTLTRDFRNRLDSIRSYAGSGKFHSLAAPVMEDVLSEVDLKTNAAWTKHLKKLQQAKDYSPEVPSSLRADLRNYQVDGFKWLARLAHWGAGACLADDMGLGKTIQALSMILLRARQGPTLVLAPTSVCVNWLEESAKFAPSLNPVRFGPGDRKQTISEAKPFDLIVCSYGLMQNEIELLSSITWTTIIADEAQAIKNFFTKRSRAAMSLPGDFKMITTGTPIENHLGELWNLFNFINPGLLGSLESFNRKFALPIQQYQDKESRMRLKKLIRPFVLRRLKSEVLSELPPRTEVTIKIDLSPEEAAIYEAIRLKALENMDQADDNPGQQRIRMLAEIMRLRRACCHPELVMPDSGHTSSKLQAFGDILDDLLENNHQALVFSQFVDHLRLTRQYLDQKKVKYQYLDGSTPAKKRHTAVNAFQAGEGNLFLISLKAGGFGLNLTAADYVIHLDPWWNPAVEDQASDRAHRIGQTRPVTIYRLVTRNTIEEKILALHTHKRDLATSLLEGTDTGSKLTLEDMLELIRDHNS